MTGWTGTPTEYDADAHAYRLEAKREYRHAKRDAERAAHEYQLAAHERGIAAWLTRRPDLWDEHAADLGVTPAGIERYAATCERLGDLFLRSSFRSTERSLECRQIAARAERAAKLGRARIAETESQMATARACERDSSWYAVTERWDRCPLCGEPWSWHRDAEPQS